MKRASRFLGAIVGGIALAASNSAQASIVYEFGVMPTMSSDETPASNLLATLTFTGLDSGGSIDDLLQVVVQNQSAYDIENIYLASNAELSSASIFTASITVGGGDGQLTDQSLLGYSVVDCSGPGQPCSAGGFGTFGLVLDGRNRIDAEIRDGNTGTFVIDLGTNIGDVAAIEAAFFPQLSTIPPGEFQKFAAMKFKSGPDDDSAFAGVIPIPAAAWLLGSALGLLAILGFRNRSQVGPMQVA